MILQKAQIGATLCLSRKMLILTDLKHLTVELREGRDKLQEEEVKVVRTMETEQEILLSSGQLQLATM